MGIQNTSLAPSFITYDMDIDNSDAALVFELGEDPTTSNYLQKFNTFKIQAGAEKGNKYSVTIDLADLKSVSESAQKDIEVRFRTLKVCQGGSEANIVVLCSQAFTD